MQDFKEAGAILKPACSIMKYRKEGGMDEESGASNGKKRKSISILSIIIKSGKGPKTRVNLRGYPQEDYLKLTNL